MNKHESAKWQCRYQVSKYNEDIGQFPGSPETFGEVYQPYEVRAGRITASSTPASMRSGTSSAAIPPTT